MGQSQPTMPILAALLLIVGSAAAPARAAAELGFAIRLDYDTSGGAHAAVAARINDDRYDDIVLATDDGVSVLFGSPGGRLSAALDAPSIGTAHSIDVGDFDGDGLNDIAIGNKYERKLRTLRGDGSGGFTARAEIELSGRPSALRATDVDGDSRIDIVVATDRGIQILSGDGRGGFVAAASALAGEAITALALADVTGDGRNEIIAFRGDRGTIQTLAVAATGGVRVISTTTLRVDLRDLHAADVDGDGWPDLVLADRQGAALMRGDGRGGFRPPERVFRGQAVAAVAVADLDRDGLVDIAVADDDRRAVALLRGRGRAPFQPAGGYNIGAGPTALVVADVDGDGRPDLVCANRRSATATLLRNQGRGRFDGAMVFDVGDDPSDAVVADLNGDGRDDLVIVDERGGRVHVLVSDGSGRLRLHTAVAVGRQSKAAVVADLDGDGQPDIAVANHASNNVSVVLRNDAGGFMAPLFVGVGRGPSAITVVDANGDPYPDLAVANTLSNSVSLLINDGGGLFPEVRNLPVIERPEFLVRGDVQGQGREDLVVGRSRDTKVTVLARTDAGYQQSEVREHGRPVQPTVSADLDLDGHIDLIVPVPERDVVEILRGRPGGGIETPREVPAGRRPVAVAVGDFDWDGLPDIAVVQRGSRTLMLLLNTSRGARGAAARPAPASATPTQANPWRRPEAADSNPAWSRFGER